MNLANEFQKSTTVTQQEAEAQQVEIILRDAIKYLENLKVSAAASIKKYQSKIDVAEKRLEAMGVRADEGDRLLLDAYYAGEFDTHITKRSEKKTPTAAEAMYSNTVSVPSGFTMHKMMNSYSDALMKDVASPFFNAQAEMMKQCMMPQQVDRRRRQAEDRTHRKGNSDPIMIDIQKRRIDG